MRRVSGALTSLIHVVRTSLRYRLVLLTTLTIVLGTAVAGVATYEAARVSLYGQLDLELLAIAGNVSDQFAEDFQSSGHLSSIENPLNAENVAVVLVKANTNVDPRVTTADRPINIDYHEIAIARTQSGTSARDGTSGSGAGYRIVAVPLLDTSTGDAYAVVIARELAPTSSGLRNLSALQWVISLGVIVLGLGMSMGVAAATLNPIKKLTSVVSDITSTNDLTPIEVHGASEVAELERSFNAMLSSLAQSRTQQSRLIADAGHELRTPLTSLRTNIELLVADEKSHMLPPDVRSQILSDVAAQLGEFTSLVNDLVALSRGDTAPSEMTPLDFSGVVERAIGRAKRRGPSLVFDVRLEPITIMGDAVMLERAVTNLLDNAVKFSPPAGTITVRLSHGGGLTVTDQGPGVADQDAPHIFERFYRSDSSRNTPGTGLGLSIVAQTIHTHGGAVEVGRAAGGGAVFTVHLPEVAASEVDPDE
ncbi:MAG: HAMP domain-containing histidine kinase [Propionibacteriaceae bacterium]|nr:HAMP domain-containing histidine kinase [Propionibacteriaceae bacterium]